MKILAFDTSSSACSVALLIDDKITAVHRIAPMQQAQIILPIIDELLLAAHITLSDLNCIAFGRGPGSFAGLRIATSVAQGLGFAANLPLVPISSLAALAQAAYDDFGWERLLVAVDARINEIYWGEYIVQQGLVSLQHSELLCNPEAVAQLDLTHGYGVGNGWDVYYQTLGKFCHNLTIDATRLPMASAMLKLAAAKYNNNELITAEDAEPVYLRNRVV